MVAEEQKGQRIYELMPIEGRILEMSGITPIDGIVNVPIDSRIDISAITADDPDPKFVNVEVLRTGVSKTNRRRYNGPVVNEVSEMTPGVQGFLGHPDPTKQGFEFREPQCIFVGSTVQEMDGGGRRSVAKAYLFKTSPLREWIPKSIAAKNPMTVSINGIGDVIRNGDVLDVLHISELQSIDWANPGTEGMGTSQAMSVVNEMQNDKGGSASMDGNGSGKEILKNATIAEFKAYNPDAYTGMIKGMTISELQLVNPELFKQVQESGKITEMQLTVDGKQQTVKIAEVQNVISGIENRITELQGKLETAVIAEYKNRKIAEQVPQNLRDQISKRVSGKTEKDIDDSLTAELAYVREMGGKIICPQVASTRMLVTIL
jgi:hypothetical protein